MIIKIAWRNIWRNPVRSWIVIMALTVGMFAGVFSTTFMHGWMMQRLRAAIETETSHIQVHLPGFKMAEDIKSYFTHSDSLVKQIKNINGVHEVSPRIVISAMVASAETAAGIQVYGIEPSVDSMVVDVSKQLKEGKWFTGIRRNPIIIGHKLAEKLKVKLRSKIILRFQDHNGDFSGGAFRVAGIYRTLNSAYDESNIFVRRNDLVSLLNLPEDVSHEIAIRCEDPTVVDKIYPMIVSLAPELKVESWKEISPELGYITETANMYMYIFVIIILFALGFGIVNTMLMVVLERVHELGMLMAVGMKRIQVFSMILLETLMLSVLGGFIGIILGVGATELTAKKGIDLSIWAEGLSEMGFASIIYPEYNAEMVIGVAILVVLTGVIAAIYPAIKALKLSPSQALQSI
jgi:ABC-type lipoprotein release transport system permease subunit